jgi:subtilisin family serine protease
MRNLFLTTALITVSMAPAYANEYINSPQLKQIKLDKTIQTFAKNGKGITIAVVDTGINQNHSEVAGRVSSQSTCVATGNCWLGFSDTNFHGTFVASIAAGSQNGTGMVGVAPQANILAVKIAQPSGSAFTNDLNSGLMAAANRGAHVINLSYGSFFGPRTTPIFATYNASLVSTLNAVATKGATTVIAGGNSSVTFMDNANQGGFTSAALSRLLFVGSVNSSNTLSSFSNTPGTTKFTTTDGKTTALSSIWLMAPGDNLAGAYFAGNNSYVSASGTSFSAPQVSGGLALLESRWSVLYRNGTAAKVLLDTATDLGVKGVDNVYGAGLMDLNKAFLPIGNLTIRNAKGTAINVTQINGSMISSGAFGSLSTIRTKLSNMSAFDNYSRDFSVNLSTLIATKPSAATVTLARGSQVVGSSYKFAEGGALSFGESISTVPESFQDSNMEGSRKNFYLSMTDTHGTTTSGGYGFSATPSFAEAMWGVDSPSAKDMSALGLSNDLLSLAQGGTFVAFGERLNENSRYALSWSQTAPSDSFLNSSDLEESHASAIGLGFSKQMSDTWTSGVTFNYLDEKNQLFGATYANSPISFGEKNQSLSIGLSSTFVIDEDSHFSMDAAIAQGKGQNVENSLIESVSDIYSQSIGVSYTQNNSLKQGDRFSIELKQPMRVFSGSANMVTSSVDEDGNEVTTRDTVGLTPDGREIDLTLAYTAPIDEDTQWSANLSARRDDGNIRGENTLGLMFSAKMKF